MSRLVTLSFTLAVSCEHAQSNSRPIPDSSPDVHSLAADSTLADTVHTNERANNQLEFETGISGVSEPDVRTTSVCPPDMRYVEGTYCHRIKHTCIRGRLEKEHVYCPNGCDIPYTQCQEWLEDHWECLPTKPIVSKSGSIRYVPEFTSMAFCMDMYEWPNKFFEKPQVFISYFDSEKLCASVGKRLCTSAEFTLACEGDDKLPTGYGWKIDGEICNVDKPWRDWSKVNLNTKRGFDQIDQSEPIGIRAACVSPFGIFDLTGNVDEWTKLDPIDKGMSDWPGQLKGGYYAKGAHPYCRAHTDFHPPKFDFYQIGTRCCLDAPQTMRPIRAKLDSIRSAFVR